MPNHQERVRANTTSRRFSASKTKRTIPVSRQWFNRLEQYLQADERFTQTKGNARWPLLLLTLDGKILEFVDATD